MMSTNAHISKEHVRYAYNASMVSWSFLSLKKIMAMTVRVCAAMKLTVVPETKTEVICVRPTGMPLKDAIWCLSGRTVVYPRGVP